MGDLLKRIKKLENDAAKLSDDIIQNGDAAINILHFNTANDKFSMVMTMTPQAIEEMILAIMENNPILINPMLCALSEMSKSFNPEIN